MHNCTCCSSRLNESMGGHPLKCSVGRVFGKTLLYCHGHAIVVLVGCGCSTGQALACCDNNSLGWLFSCRDVARTSTATSVGTSPWELCSAYPTETALLCIALSGLHSSLEPRPLSFCICSNVVTSFATVADPVPMRAWLRAYLHSSSGFEAHHLFVACVADGCPQHGSVGPVQ